MRADEQWNNAVLQDVLFIPELNRNLLLVAHLTECGTDIQFTGTKCQLYTQSGHLTYIGQLQGKLYIMNMQTVVHKTAHVTYVESFPDEGNDLPPAAETALVTHSSSSNANVKTWHCWLGHLSTDTVIHMVKNIMVKGMEISNTATPTTPCEPCLKGKQIHTEIQTTMEMCADSVLGHVFSNVRGKLATCSHHGFKYFVTFMDDKSCKVFIAGLHQKSEVTCHWRGTKDSSVLDRALSRIRDEIQAETSPTCLTKVEGRKENASPIVCRDRRDSTWILRDQVSSYLYYFGYTEPPMTKATQNTPVVRI